MADLASGSERLCPKAIPGKREINRGVRWRPEPQFWLPPLAANSIIGGRRLTARVELLWTADQALNGWLDDSALMGTAYSHRQCALCCHAKHQQSRTREAHCPNFRKS